MIHPAGQFGKHFSGWAASIPKPVVGAAGIGETAGIYLTPKYVILINSERVSCAESEESVKMA